MTVSGYSSVDIPFLFYFFLCVLSVFCFLQQLITLCPLWLMFFLFLNSFLNFDLSFSILIFNFYILAALPYYGFDEISLIIYSLDF